LVGRPGGDAFVGTGCPLDGNPGTPPGLGKVLGFGFVVGVVGRVLVGCVGTVDWFDSDGKSGLFDVVVGDGGGVVEPVGWSAAFDLDEVTTTAAMIPPARTSTAIRMPATHQPEARRCGGRCSA
jgi:hypothetical protein